MPPVRVSMIRNAAALFAMLGVTAPVQAETLLQIDYGWRMDGEIVCTPAFIESAPWRRIVWKVLHAVSHWEARGDFPQCDDAAGSCLVCRFHRRLLSGKSAFCFGNMLKQSQAPALSAPNGCGLSAVFDDFDAPKVTTLRKSPRPTSL